ncbi:hypothetical protein K491DRAFT_773790 [Lophiostoma macrostomum CBS 122681]|uniref:ABM domain-containing protein n=1 Tax=Lophiostoma macrostomum CBS 122681 TaxID=1314788 RepID=A0A6A6TPX1_9PLEO|nr:hypothetical protein K491DRAFT_773790 [Lophiostoma macrostomum CBS 122681]
MAIIEIGRMGVKPNHNVMDESTPEGKILRDTWERIIEQPTGPHRLFWGLEDEEPLRIWGIFEWDSVEHHQKFAREYGAELVKDFPKILTHGEFTKHISPTTFPLRATQSPVTELLLAYFSADISPELRDAATTKMQQFVENIVGKSSEVQAVNYGWSVENDLPFVGGEDGQKGALLMAFIGWPSLDAKSKFKDTKASKENSGLISGMEGLRKLTTVHVRFRSLERK